MKFVWFPVSYPKNENYWGNKASDSGGGLVKFQTLNQFITNRLTAVNLEAHARATNGSFSKLEEQTKKIQDSAVVTADNPRVQDPQTPRSVK